ncbi:FecR family protein [Sphingomonas morindae]|uniref:FecR domain-containing protein n=1 Tax=Sphingomonas morindae TaxID=1541170 RepID=A0ABY4XCV2_9SPHN|nr:FecR domain-containing protein [Sphingomonas morindae]USI74669.1 FecR domain-containing protein [Sphingomonas morindae]
MDRGPLSEEDATTLEAWLGENPSRLGALARARAWLARDDAISSHEPLLDPDQSSPQERPLSRRRLLMSGGGALAAALGAGAIGYGLTATHVYATARGERREVVLENGSRITLNTLSEVQSRNWFGARDLRLDRGEVLLAAAGGPASRTCLRVGDWRLEAATALLFVSDLPGRRPEATVHRGFVDISGPAGVRGVRLEQQHRLALAPAARLDRQIERCSADQLARELAWMQGQIAFRDEALGDAVQAFARYSARPLILRDPALARETISGVYAADDAAGFARAIGTAFGVAIRTEPDRILIG